MIIHDIYLKWEWSITLLSISHSNWHPGNKNCLGLLKDEWIVLNRCYSKYFSRCAPSPRLNCLPSLFESPCQYPDRIQNSTACWSYPCTMSSKCLFSAAVHLPPSICRSPTPVLARNAPSRDVDTETLSWEFLKTNLKGHEA